MQMDIPSLVQKAKAGDQVAFGQIYDEFSDRILRFLLLKVSDRQEAQDLFQETFVRAWRGLDGFRLENSNFSAWLYKIASNCATDYYRRKGAKPDPLELDETMEIHASYSDPLPGKLDKELEMDKVKKAFELLPPQYKEVLELRYIQDLTISETAEVLKKTGLAVRMLQHHALNKLRQII